MNNYFSRATTSRQTRSGALNEANYNRILPEDNAIGWTEKDEAAVQKELTQIQLGQLRDRLATLQQAATSAKGNQKQLRGIVQQVTKIRDELQQIQSKKQKPVGPASYTAATP